MTVARTLKGGNSVKGGMGKQDLEMCTKTVKGYRPPIGFTNPIAEHPVPQPSSPQGP